MSENNKTAEVKVLDYFRPLQNPLWACGTATHSGTPVHFFAEKPENTGLSAYQQNPFIVNGKLKRPEAEDFIVMGISIVPVVDTAAQFDALREYLATEPLVSLRCNDTLLLKPVPLRYIIYLPSSSMLMLAQLLAEQKAEIKAMCCGGLFGGSRLTEWVPPPEVDYECLHSQFSITPAPITQRPESGPVTRPTPTVWCDSKLMGLLPCASNSYFRLNIGRTAIKLGAKPVCASITWTAGMEPKPLSTPLTLHCFLHGLLWCVLGKD